MMKKYYSIGETAAIMKMSVQTLRYYANSDLLKPEYVDPSTSYRYFSFKQFHIIDRIKFLREMGMPISDIENILKNGNVGLLKKCLEKQKNSLEKKISILKEQYEDNIWYLDYFSYIKNNEFGEIPYIKHYDTRYVMYVAYQPEDTVESIETALFRLKYENENLGFHYRRQFGFFADLNMLLEGSFKPNAYFTYLKSKPEKQYSFIKEIPAGRFLCFQGALYNGKWDITYFKKYLLKFSTDSFEHIIANEFENSLFEYKDCPYEVQVRLSD
jgi:DNA-binding transcriptional MerR regulator